MARQESTKQFGPRLRQAVEGHPLAPDGSFGQQAWLREKLKREAGIEVSANAVHKWFGGDARPREDTLRKLAKILSVDEVWLSMGVTPMAEPKSSEAPPPSARGAAMAIAGLVEMAGGRAIFEDEDGVSSLRVRIKGPEVRVVVAEFRCGGGGKGTVIVPEPVGEARILVARQRDDEEHSVCLDLYDFTDSPRQMLGGFSVIEVERRKANKLKVHGINRLLDKLASLSELSA